MPLHAEHPPVRRRATRRPPPRRRARAPPPRARRRRARSPGDAASSWSPPRRRSPRARREPAASSSACTRAPGDPTRRRAAAWPGHSLGMSCTSVPPSATFATWTPRQMASVGRRRARAARTSASSKASRRACTSPSAGCGAVAVVRGIHVLPAREDEAAHPRQRRVGILGRQHGEEQGQEPGAARGVAVRHVGPGPLETPDDLGGRGDGDRWERRHEGNRPRLRGCARLLYPKRGPPAAPAPRRNALPATRRVPPLACSTPSAKRSAT